MADTFKQTIGKNSEDYACHFLQTNGLQLIERNFRCRFGEIDLIMQENDSMVFVEVRTRNRTDYGNALESISRSKQRKVIRTAAYFLQQQKLYDKIACRFDVISLQNHADETTLEWIKNAFY